MGLVLVFVYQLLRSNPLKPFCRIFRLRRPLTLKKEKIQILVLVYKKEMEALIFHVLLNIIVWAIIETHGSLCFVLSFWHLFITTIFIFFSKRELFWYIFLVLEFLLLKLSLNILYNYHFFYFCVWWVSGMLSKVSEESIWPRKWY